MKFSREVLGALLIALIVFPWLPWTSGMLGSAALAAEFAIVAASLVLLTGWIGQISLAHGAFVGIGAYATGWATGTFGLTFPLSMPVAALVAGVVAAGLGAVALRVRGLYLAVATLIFAWAASEYLFRQQWVVEHGSIAMQEIGEPGMLFYLDFTSRTTYYYVAWATALAVLFSLVNLRDSKTGRAFFSLRDSEMAAASLGIGVLKYKALGFALSGAIAGIAGSLRMSHSMVVSPDAFDINASLFFLAIAVVGGLTSLPGAVAAGVVFAAMEELFFRIPFLNEYLQLVSTGLLVVVFLAYPGGLAALGNASVRRSAQARVALRAMRERLEGRLANAGVRTALDEARAADGAVGEDAVAEETVEERPLLSSAWDRLLANVNRMLARRKAVDPATGGGFLSLEVATALSTPSPTMSSADDPAEGEPVTAEPSAEETTDVSADGGADDGKPLSLIARAIADVTAPDTSTRSERPALVEAVGLTKRFGGLTAVNDASLSVHEGEIVGLIGPNGAGKTTLFNMVAGFLEPTEGRVRLYGHDVTELPVHRRAQLGVARTFQIIQLFPQLSVFDNLLTATHLQNPTGFVQHMAVSPAALHAEHAARSRVRQVVDLLDLAEVADRPVAGLPFGILRMVEVARALVSGARLIMLDEPASGLDERETDELTDVLRFVRSLGATVLLIEHDVRMVTSVSDYMYVIDRGTMIADGPPAQIQSDPAVIAAYLGQAPAPAEVV